MAGKVAISGIGPPDCSDPCVESAVLGQIYTDTTGPTFYIKTTASNPCDPNDWTNLCEFCASQNLTITDNLDGTYDISNGTDTVCVNLCGDRVVSVVPDSFSNPSLLIINYIDGSNNVITLPQRVTSGAGAPAGAPADPAITYTYLDTTTGDFYAWDPVGASWVQLGSFTETVTTLVDNGDGTYTYTNEDAVPVTFNAGWTTVNGVSPGVFRFTYPDGSTIDIDHCAELDECSLGALGDVDLVSSPPMPGQFLSWDGTDWVPGSSTGETVTTLVDNGNGTYTYTNELGAPVTFNEGWTTVVNNGDGSATFTFPNGDTVTLDICAMLTNCSIGALDDVDVTTTPPNPGEFLMWNGNDWVPGSASGEVVTTLVDNGNGTYTYTNEAGAPVTFNEGWTDVTDNGDGTITFSFPDSSSLVVDICSLLTNCDIGQLSNVDTSVPPSDGQALVWDGANWSPSDGHHLVLGADPPVFAPDFPLEPYLYIDTDNYQPYVWNPGLAAWEIVPTDDTFSITDGATTESIVGGDTITFQGGDGATAIVTAPDTVSFSGHLLLDADPPVDPPPFSADQPWMYVDTDTDSIYTWNPLSADWGISTFNCFKLNSCSIDYLADVDTTTIPPVSGNSLVYDGSEWAPLTVLGKVESAGLPYAYSDPPAVNTFAWTSSGRLSEGTVEDLLVSFLSVPDHVAGATTVEIAVGVGATAYAKLTFSEPVDNLQILLTDMTDSTRLFFDVLSAPTSVDGDLTLNVGASVVANTFAGSGGTMYWNYPVQVIEMTQIQNNGGNAPEVTFSTLQAEFPVHIAPAVPGAFNTHIDTTNRDVYQWSTNLARWIKLS